MDNFELSLLELDLLELERVFYEDETRFMGENESCNYKKGLPCNCLTGLGLNFWGYVLENCYEIDLTSSIEMDQGCIFFRSKGIDAETCQYKLLAPVYAMEQGDYLLQNIVIICDENKNAKPDSKPNKAFLKRRYQGDYDLDELNRRVENLDIQRELRISEATELTRFLKRAIIAMRTKPIAEECQAFFSFAMFFFPDRTGKLVYDYLQTEQGNSTENRDCIKQYLEKYDKFLNQLSQHAKDDYTSYGVLAKFSCAFEELTGIWVGEWLEENRDDLPSYEMITSALMRNCQEKDESNRNGIIRIMQSVCNNW